MKNLKLIIFTILIIIIILIYILIANNINNSQENGNIDENLFGNNLAKPNYELEETKSASTFTTLSNAINIFLKYLNENNSEALKNILINDYLKNGNSEILPKVNYAYGYKINKVARYESKLFITTYFVYGDILNKENKSKKEFNLVINIDDTNKTFDLAPMGEVYKKYIDYSDYNNIKVDKAIENEISNIKLNEYNKIEIANGFRR